jgi:hypothetical protein
MIPSQQLKQRKEQAYASEHQRTPTYFPLIPGVSAFEKVSPFPANQPFEVYTTLPTYLLS